MNKVLCVGDIITRRSSGGLFRIGNISEGVVLIDSLKGDSGLRIALAQLGDNFDWIGPRPSDLCPGDRVKSRTSLENLLGTVTGACYHSKVSIRWDGSVVDDFCLYGYSYKDSGIYYYDFMIVSDTRGIIEPTLGTKFIFHEAKKAMPEAIREDINNYVNYIASAMDKASNGPYPDLSFKEYNEKHQHTVVPKSDARHCLKAQDFGYGPIHGGSNAQPNMSIDNINEAVNEITNDEKYKKANGGYPFASISPVAPITVNLPRWPKENLVSVIPMRGPVDTQNALANDFGKIMQQHDKRLLYWDKNSPGFKARSEAWSAELRLKVAAAKAEDIRKEKERVVCQGTLAVDLDWD